MNKLALALALLALVGCEPLQVFAVRHPYVTGFAATSLVLTAGGALRHNANTDTDRHLHTPTVSCSQRKCT